MIEADTIKEVQVVPRIMGHHDRVLSGYSELEPEQIVVIKDPRRHIYGGKVVELRLVAIPEAESQLGVRLGPLGAAQGLRV